MTDLFRKFSERLVPPIADLPHKAFEESKTYDSEALAQAAFEVAQNRLLHPQQWESLTHHLGARFQPYDARQNALSGMVSLGDYLKIELPIPGDPYYDWVRIEALESLSEGAEQLMGLRVRPTEDLQDASHRTAHFFSQKATSTWLLHRSGKTVSAYYFGRGEVRNKAGENFWKKLRDTLIAWVGVAGFSDLQWKGMLKGLLTDKP